MTLIFQIILISCFVEWLSIWVCLTISCDWIWLIDLGEECQALWNTFLYRDMRYQHMYRLFHINMTSCFFSIINQYFVSCPPKLLPTSFIAPWWTDWRDSWFSRFCSSFYSLITYLLSIVLSPSHICSPLFISVRVLGHLFFVLHTLLLLHKVFHFGHQVSPSWFTGSWDFLPVWPHRMSQPHFDLLLLSCEFRRAQVSTLHKHGAQGRQRH